MSDIEAKWSKSMGLDKDLSARGFGVRTERYGMVLDNLVVKYVGVSFYIFLNSYPTNCTHDL